MRASNQSIKIVICGSGAGAHALAGVLSRSADVAVTIFTKSSEKVAQWQAVRRDGPLLVRIHLDQDQRELEAGAVDFTDDPVAAAKDCDLLLFAVPAFTHAEYLRRVQAYLPKGCVIMGLPGQNGFEWEVGALLGSRLADHVLINFDSFPWICRLQTFGREVCVTGVKQQLLGAVQGDLSLARVADPVGLIHGLLGPKPVFKVSGHMLGITLMALNAYSHPPIMYGRWHQWDGRPLAEPALFYREVDAFTGALLEGCSAEVVACAQKIMQLVPEVDLSGVIPMYEWDMACYGDRITDPTNQMTVLRTNPGYRHIKHPMLETEAGYVPNFGHRFLSEDVPYGLAVIRGVTQIVGVPTPNIDRVLLWAQEKLGKRYLVDGVLRGTDVMDSRCPQRFGIKTLGALLGLVPATTGGNQRGDLVRQTGAKQRGDLRAVVGGRHLNDIAANQIKPAQSA